MSRRKNFIDGNDNFREQNLRFVRNEFEENINQFFGGDAAETIGRNSGPPPRDSIVVQPTPDGKTEVFRSIEIDERAAFLRQLGLNRGRARTMAIATLKVPEFNLHNLQWRRHCMSVDSNEHPAQGDAFLLREIIDMIDTRKAGATQRPRTPPPPRDIDWNESRGGSPDRREEVPRQREVSPFQTSHRGEGIDERGTQRWRRNDSPVQNLSRRVRNRRDRERKKELFERNNSSRGRSDSRERIDYFHQRDDNWRHRNVDDREPNDVHRAQNDNNRIQHDDVPERYRNRSPINNYRDIDADYRERNEFDHCERNNVFRENSPNFNRQFDRNDFSRERQTFEEQGPRFFERNTYQASPDRRDEQNIRYDSICEPVNNFGLNRRSPSPDSYGASMRNKMNSNYNAHPRDSPMNDNRHGGRLEQDFCPDYGRNEFRFNNEQAEQGFYDEFNQNYDGGRDIVGPFQRNIPDNENNFRSREYDAERNVNFMNENQFNPGFQINFNDGRFPQQQQINTNWNFNGPPENQSDDNMENAGNQGGWNNYSTRNEPCWNDDITGNESNWNDMSVCQRMANERGINFPIVRVQNQERPLGDPFQNNTLNNSQGKNQLRIQSKHNGGNHPQRGLSNTSPSNRFPRENLQTGNLSKNYSGNNRRIDLSRTIPPNRGPRENPQTISSPKSLSKIDGGNKPMVEPPKTNPPNRGPCDNRQIVLPTGNLSKNDNPNKTIGGPSKTNANANSSAIRHNQSKNIRGSNPTISSSKTNPLKRGSSENAQTDSPSGNLSKSNIGKNPKIISSKTNPSNTGPSKNSQTAPPTGNISKNSGGNKSMVVPSKTNPSNRGPNGNPQTVPLAAKQIPKNRLNQGKALAKKPILPDPPGVTPISNRPMGKKPVGSIGEKRKKLANPHMPLKKRRLSEEPLFVIAGLKMPHFEYGGKELPQPEEESYAVTFFEQEFDYNTSICAASNSNSQNVEEDEDDDYSDDETGNAKVNPAFRKGKRKCKAMAARIDKEWTKLYRLKNLKSWPNWWKAYKWVEPAIEKELQKFGPRNVKESLSRIKTNPPRPKTINSIMKSAHFALQENTTAHYRNGRTLFALMDHKFLNFISPPIMAQLQDMIGSVPNHIWLYKMRGIIYLWSEYYKEITAKHRDVNLLAGFETKWKRADFHWMCKQVFNELKTISAIEWEDHDVKYPLVVSTPR